MNLVFDTMQRRGLMWKELERRRLSPAPGHYRLPGAEWVASE